MVITKIKIKLKFQKKNKNRKGHAERKPYERIPNTKIQKIRYKRFGHQMRNN